MTTLEEAKFVWQQKKKQFRKHTPTRTAYLGDGRGYAASNIVVDNNPSMFYAREKMSDDKFFVVPNFNAAVNPQFNLPVVLGYNQVNPNIEQILGVDMSIFPYQSSASVLGGLGPHHRQHEFGGGDEVFIDPELIKIGLFTPDSPPTFGGYIQPFYYSHPTDGLRVFSGSRLDGIESYKPSASMSVRFVSVTLNPFSGNLVYRPGDELSAATGGSYTLEQILASGGSALIPGGTAAFPAIPGGEIPIATFLLESDTTSINWSSTSSAYYHSRLFLGKVDTDIYARLGNIENKIGISSLPRTGVGERGRANLNYHDGDFRIGRINDRQITGSSSPSWGSRLYFSGALGTGSWNSENSDPLWFARYNYDNDVSFLRLSIGDNPSTLDSFQIGYTIADEYSPLFSFTMGKRFGIGTSSPSRALDVDSDTIRLRQNRTISASTAPGAKGDFCWDASYIYVCSDTNIWKRASLGW
jgi:hypothetical protein